MIIEKRKGRFLVRQNGEVLGLFGSMREACLYIWRLKTPPQQMEMGGGSWSAPPPPPDSPPTLV